MYVVYCKYEKYLDNFLENDFWTPPQTPSTLPFSILVCKIKTRGATRLHSLIISKSICSVNCAGYSACCGKCVDHSAQYKPELCSTS